MKNKCRLTDTIQEVVIKMSEGNPGCLNVLMQLLENYSKIDPQATLGAFGQMLCWDDMGLYGTDIYILYADKCNRNLRRLIMLMRACQLGIIDKSFIIGMAKDQMREINLSEEEFIELDDRVCKELEEFQKRVE